MKILWTNRTQQAFYLLEISIVIAVIAFLCTLAISTVRTSAPTLLRMELHKLYTLCMHLQQKAMTTQQEQTLTFDTQAGKYAGGGYNNALPQEIIFGTLAQLQGPPSTPTTVVKDPVSFVGKKIVFKTNGTIQPGTIYLTDKDHCYQMALSVPISQISHMRMYQYTTQWILQS